MTESTNENQRMNLNGVWPLIEMFVLAVSAVVITGAYADSGCVVVSVLLGLRAISSVAVSANESNKSSSVVAAIVVLAACGGNNDEIPPSLSRSGACSAKTAGECSSTPGCVAVFATAETSDDCVENAFAGCMEGSNCTNQATYATRNGLCYAFVNSCQPAGFTHLQSSADANRCRDTPNSLDACE